MKKDDLLPVLIVTLTDDDDTAEDLTTASGVTVRIKKPDDTVLALRACVVAADPTTGVVTYTWQAGDTDTAGLLDLEFLATFSAKVKTFPSRGFVKVQVAGILE